MPALKPYTFAIHISPKHKPKIAKEYVLPTRFKIVEIKKASVQHFV